MALPQQTANSNDITSVIASLAPRQAGKERSEIPGPKRAAMLMLALGDQYGGKVWQLLDDDEVRELSIAMSRPTWSRKCCSNSSRACRLPAR
jgi:flagellar motor switch protein FliG